MTDIELIASAMRGREAGFEERVRRYQRPITNYVFRMLNDYDSSRDVTQGSIHKGLQLAQRTARIQVPDLLYRIAHNAAIDCIRFRKSPNQQSLEAENGDGPYQLQLEGPNPTPEQERGNGVNGELRSQRSSKCLPAAYRELILLRHSQDLSYDEIAEITNLPLGTVKNRLFRPRDDAREIFIERGFKAI
ncbi:MAG: hypothetical protein IPJ30_13720 [Acidobacteria bacterium]|nr:hypothetical protein [Acidobacteriota bacterium]